MDLEGLAFWSFEALKVSEGAFGCCKCILFLFECMFDTIAYDLSVLSVKNFF